MITEQQFKDSACALGCSVAAIKAVHKVEGGAGMINDRPIILFEPHLFWKQLKARGIDPALHQKGNEEILYPVWRTRPYPKSQDSRYAQLDKASKIHREAALCSASWGMFQICGFNWKLCGCATLQQFVNSMYHSQNEHLKLFCNYIKSVGLDDELRAFSNPTLIVNATKQFARGYNGEYYYKNAYDVKLRNAYNSFK